MPGDTQIVNAKVADGNSDYTLPDSMGFRLKAVNATFADNGAGVTYLPAVVLFSDSGHVIAHAVDTSVSVAAGGSAVTSFFPGVRRRGTGGGLTLDFNIGEIGNVIGKTLGSTTAAPVQYQDINVGEGILILAAAPSVEVLGHPASHPLGVLDAPGNTYTALASFAFEANPPNVNEGVYATLFWCPGNLAPLVAGTDSITVFWDGNVFDRVISIWSVRHSGGPHTPTVLAATADNDAAAYAAGQITLTSPNWTPARDKALMFALVISVKVGGTGAFGGVAGWNGYFQAESRNYGGAKQNYLINPQTHGADAYLIAGAVPAPFEDDVGVLPGGVLVPAFNGVAQGFSNGTNAWKGIIILGLD